MSETVGSVVVVVDDLLLFSFVLLLLGFIESRFDIGKAIGPVFVGDGGTIASISKSLERTRRTVGWVVAVFADEFQKFAITGRLGLEGRYDFWGHLDLDGAFQGFPVLLSALEQSRDVDGIGPFDFVLFGGQFAVSKLSSFAGTPAVLIYGILDAFVGNGFFGLLRLFFRYGVGLLVGFAVLFFEPFAGFSHFFRGYAHRVALWSLSSGPLKIGPRHWV